MTDFKIGDRVGLQCPPYIGQKGRIVSIAGTEIMGQFMPAWYIVEFNGRRLACRERDLRKLANPRTYTLEEILSS